MQTFLPYPDFRKSLESLDNKRLGKQRVESWQILQLVALGRYQSCGKPWGNHPAVLMWHGHYATLLDYYNLNLEIWQERGYKNIKLKKLSFLPDCRRIDPDWLGNPELHLSHQSNLIRKFPEHYQPIFGYDIPNNLEYFWPTKNGY